MNTNAKFYASLLLFASLTGIPAQDRTSDIEELRKLPGTFISLDDRGFVSTLDSNGKLSDELLRLVKRFDEIRELQTIDGEMSNEGLRALEGAQKLQVLTLVRAKKISDDGIKTIAKLSNLTYLDLSDTQVTDSCIESLLKLKRLERLVLLRTKITAEGIKKIKTHFPTLDIELP